MGASANGMQTGHGPGLFITFEGIERTGKTTQAQKLKHYLESKGWTVVLTREPGGTPSAEAIRELLLHRRGVADMSPLTETMLMAAARADHVENVLQPALAEGHAVISDRFADSTFAYQGYGLGVDLEHIDRLNEMATGGLMPHLTILLNCRTEVMDRRSNLTGNDRIEGRTRKYYERVQEGFLARARSDLHRIKVIDGERSVEAVWAAVRNVVEGLLRERRPYERDQEPELER